MGVLNRRVLPKKYCECIDDCGTEIPLHCHFATGHQFRGATPHNKGTAKPIELHPCACGCLEMVKGKFKRGHNARVDHWSKGPDAAAICEAISVFASQRTGEKGSCFGKTKETNPSLSNSGAKKGTVPWNKDLHDYFSEEALAGISAGRKGIPAWNSGVKNCHSPEVVAIISENSKKLVHTEEFKNNLSVRMRTSENPWYVDGRCSGENRSYPLAFGEDLKEFVRDRDHRQCQICSKSEKDMKKKLDVHHIDYDKMNCGPNNLVSLCHRCHTKTNTKKNRPYWISFFKDQQNNANADFWLSSINPLITGSGYIPDPYRATQMQLSA